MVIFQKIYKAFCSLKLAVCVILILAIALAAGTILESIYDTPTSQYWVYRSFWFRGVLAALGVNIFCVAMSRLPWKPKHIPFLLAHAGILILLLGSWITERAGIDGNLRITEGETASIVEMDSAYLVVSDSKNVYPVSIPWIPPHVTFQPLQLASQKVPFDLEVDQYLTHADPSFSFTPNPSSPNVNSAVNSKKGMAALHLRMTGGPMKISQDFWLWEGSPGWSSMQAGPARLVIGAMSDEVLKGAAVQHQPTFAVQPQKDGSLQYIAQSSEGKRIVGRVAQKEIAGKVIHPGWKGDVTLHLLEWIPDAVGLTHYKPAHIQYGNQAPSSAIHVTASRDADVWLGLGDRAILHVGDRDVEIGYYPRRIVLPFSIRLERFSIEHDQGTLSPASYSSRVTAIEKKGHTEALISMNEPLEIEGFTVYQASYEEGNPRPVTSIFSVNRDPGRLWKYSGSLLIVLGSVLLFAGKYRRRKRSLNGSESTNEKLVENFSSAYDSRT